ncbi:MAG: cyclopropane-fatty-acyl-phospholipid synthase family protein [Pirellulales bacterium]
MPVLPPPRPVSRHPFTEQSKLVPNTRLIAQGTKKATSTEDAQSTGPWFRRLVLGRLAKIDRGLLRLRDQHGVATFGQCCDSYVGEITVRNDRFYRRVALGGSLGAGEAFLDGDWDSRELTAALRVLARNAETLRQVERGVPRLIRPLRAAAHQLRGNSLRGSRRNIARHYNLSNEFFELMLDSTMTYSSGYFPNAGATLEEASIEKYDRICRLLRLGPGDHVLEIGTGWGGFALHAVRKYGCRLTTTTISKAQHEYAAERFHTSGLKGRIELLFADYRNLRGQYDKLVSIEMIEAVGERYLPTYFERCSRLLKPEGVMLLQAITNPDYRYDEYRRRVDFIQKHVFPGGFLPCPAVITDALRRKTDLRVAYVEDFADHYALTIAAWRKKLWGNLDKVRSLGFDERFLRLWNYYLAYCEAGFLEQRIGVSQWLLSKPQWRPAR